VRAASVLRAAVCLAAVASLVSLAGCSGSDTDGSAPSGGSTASSGPASVADLDPGAVGVADVDGEAWLVQPDGGTVLPGTGKPVPVGDAPLRIVATPAGAWVSVINDGKIVRIDPASASVDRTVVLEPRGSEPEGLAWDGHSLWVVDQAGGRVVRLDPDGKVLGQVAVGDEPRLASAGDAGIWVANYGGSSVSLVHGGTARTVDVPGCTGPQGIAEAAGRAWVSCTLSSKVIALDARTLKQVAEVPEVADADAVVAAGSTVYVVGQSGPTVYVIDAASGDLTDTIVLDDAPPTSENVDAAVVGDDLVVTHPDVGRVYTLPTP
jgi:DNA-binding beta-propeller fold protein YncE